MLMNVAKSCLERKRPNMGGDSPEMCMRARTGRTEISGLKAYSFPGRFGLGTRLLIKALAEAVQEGTCINLSI